MVDLEDNLQRRDFLKKTLFLGLTILSGCNSYKVAYVENLESKSIVEKPKFEETKVTLKEGENPFILWKDALIEDGVLVDEEFLGKYNLPDPKGNLDYRIINEADNGYRNFKECAIPENFNRCAFFTSFYTVRNLEDLIKPERISKIFGLNTNDRLFKELRNCDERFLVENILRYSLILTHKKLKIDSFIIGQTFSDFILHLNEGKGDCTDYCYGTANNFYAICDLLNKPDLKSKVNIVLGVEVDRHGKIVGEHNWIEYGKKRQRLETTADKIDNDFEGNLKDYSLYIFFNENKVYVPLISTRFEDKIRHYVHCLPNIAVL